MIIGTLGNMWSPAPFQGFINDEFNWSSRRNTCPNKEHRQEVTELKR
jgi:hypothetical protein